MTRGRRAEEGSAVVEFVLVGGMVVALFLGVVQVALVVHMRNVLAASAAEGARYAANAGRRPADGAQRATEMVSASLSSTVARDVPCQGTTDRGPRGAVVVRVDCSGRLPLFFLPLGLLGVHVTGRSLGEP